MVDLAILRRRNGLGGAYVAAIVAVIIWAATPAATRFAVDALDPLAAGMLRTVLAAVLIVPVIWFLRLPFPGRSGGWPLLVASSVMGFMAFTLLFSIGVSMTSAAHAALINGMIPVFTGLFGAISERRVPRTGWWVGSIMALVGIVVLITARGGDATREATGLGDDICVASSACAALGYVTGARLAERFGAPAVTLWGVLLAGVVQAPLVFVFLPFEDLMASGFLGWVGIGYLAVLSTLVAYLLWYKALAIGGPVRMGAVQYAMPVMSVALSVFLFGDQFSVFLLSSAALVLAGIVMMRRG